MYSKAQSSLLARVRLSPGHENPNNSHCSDSSTVWPARLGAKLMRNELASFPIEKAARY